MVRLQDIKFCKCCINIFGNKDYNNEKSYAIPLSFCSSCVRDLLKWYNKNGRCFITMKYNQQPFRFKFEKPDVVKEKKMNALKMERGDTTGLSLCPSCGRLWSGVKRIYIPKGFCLSCFNKDKKTPTMKFLFDTWVFGEGKL